MRSLLRYVTVLVLVLLVAWLGLWWYAEGRMQAGLTAWAAQVSQNPEIKVSYDSVRRGVSPLAATVTLTNVVFTLQPVADQAPVTVTLPSLTERINAGNPLIAHIDLPLQINLSGSRGDAAITFGSIDVAEHLDPAALFHSTVQPFDGNDISASNISLLASSGSLQVLHMDNMALHGQLDRSAGAGQTALDASEDFTGISLSPLLTRLGSVPFGGSIAQLGLTATLTGPLPADWQGIIARMNAFPVGDVADKRKISIGALHDWAAAGGSGKVALTLQVGPSTLSADAAVQFDANVQPSGTADVTADHLDAFSAAVTAAYPQVQSNVNQIEAELSPYLTTSADGGQVLTVHVIYGNGAVSINGQKVGDMPPVDWDVLENPPATAPGDGSGAQQ